MENKRSRRAELAADTREDACRSSRSTHVDAVAAEPDDDDDDDLERSPVAGSTGDLDPHFGMASHGHRWSNSERVVDAHVVSGQEAQHRNGSAAADAEIDHRTAVDPLGDGDHRPQLARIAPDVNETLRRHPATWPDTSSSRREPLLSDKTQEAGHARSVGNLADRPGSRTYLQAFVAVA